MLIYGLNPVIEALRAKRVTRVRVSARQDKRMDEVLALAGAQRVPVERVDAQTLDRAARGGVHQGVVAEIEAARDYDVTELAAAAGATPLIVVLDGIEDPHNVGAILRTCDAAAATGVIRQTRHSAALDGVVGKASAGALVSRGTPARPIRTSTGRCRPRWCWGRRERVCAGSSATPATGWSAFRCWGRWTA